MSTDLYATGRRMSYASNSTATAASYSAGFKANLPDNAFVMGASPNGARYRGVVLEYYGAAADATLGSRVWAFHPAMSADGRISGYNAQCIATVVGTSAASALVIPTSHAGTVGAYIYDDLTVTTTTTATTPKGPGATINAAMNSAAAQAFAPNDNATPGFVIIPDCGNPSHIYVELWDAAANATNGFIEGIT